MGKWFRVSFDHPILKKAANDLAAFFSHLI